MKLSALSQPDKVAAFSTTIEGTSEYENNNQIKLKLAPMVNVLAFNNGQITYITLQKLGLWTGYFWNCFFKINQLLKSGPQLLVGLLDECTAGLLWKIYCRQRNVPGF